MIKIKNGFSQVFISNVIPKTNTKVGYGCLWGVAVEILKKNSKMKNLFENDLLYECVTFHEFGRHIFTWSWISIYDVYFLNFIVSRALFSKKNITFRWFFSNKWFLTIFCGQCLISRQCIFLGYLNPHHASKWLILKLMSMPWQ